MKTAARVLARCIDGYEKAAAWVGLALVAAAVLIGVPSYYMRRFVANLEEVQLVRWASWVLAALALVFAGLVGWTLWGCR